MDFRILGSLEVANGASDVPIRGGRQRTLLALLLVRPRTTVSAERLADELWGDDVPSGGANALQSLVSKLRRALGPASALLVTDASGYRLDVGADSIDAARFESAAARGRAALAGGDAATASAELRAALSLWRGDALEGLADEGVLQREATRLEEARLAALEDRYEADLALGRHAELVGELEASVAAHPLRERLHGFLMLSLYRAGRQAESLRAYQEARQLLSDELGLEPSVELRDLERAILAQDASLHLPASPTPARAVSRSTNLGPELSTFIGRKEDLRALDERVDLHRLVTVVGPGGAGKTRLAREVGALRGTEEDVWLVELAPLGDPAAVADAVAAAVGAAEQSLSRPGAGGAPEPAGALARSAERIGIRPTLLLLDNCEHVISEAARVVEYLLRTCGRLRILATSREGLGVVGESVWAVPPMAVDDGVSLFTDRARAVSGFELTPTAEKDVRELCTRLDGLPLAIELAAARTRAIPVHQLAARLDDRFRLLTGGARTALPRQQTLRAVVEWSYDLLFDDERTVFECLSVFAGGCTLEGAEAVCATGDVDPGDVADLLAHLVDKSLVVADHSGGDVRYHLLQTLALYGRERLSASGGGEATRARHAAYFGQLCALGPEAFRGRNQVAWLADVAREADNLRAAIAWAIEQDDAELALAMVGGLGWSWWMAGGAEEGYRLLEGALACAGDSQPATRARAALWAEYVGAIAGVGMARALHWAELALSLWRESDDTLGLAEALVLHGDILASAGSRAEAEHVFEEAHALLLGAEGEWERAVAALGAGWAALMRNDLELGERLTAESVTHFDAAGSVWIGAAVNASVAALAELRGDYRTAIDRNEVACEVAQRLGIRRDECLLLARLGTLWFAIGEPERAEACHDAALALADEGGYTTGRALALNARAVVRRAAGQLDEAEAYAQQARAVYRTLEFQQGEVLSLATLGFVAERRGDLDVSRRFHEEAFVIARRVGVPSAVALALEGLAGVAAAAGDGERAARLLGHAGRLRQGYGGGPAGPTSDVERITDACVALLGVGAFARACEDGAAAEVDSLLL